MTFGGPDAARADELPRSACAIRLDFANFRGAVLNVIRTRAPELFEDHGPFSLRIGVPQITPHLGQLDYDSTGRPMRNPAGGNNELTSNDDLLDIRIPIDVRLEGSTITTFYVRMGVAFPQSAPPHLQNGGSRSCNCRKVSDTHLSLIHELRRCDPNNQADHAVCVYLPPTAALRPGENYVDGTGHPFADWYNLFALYPERPIPEYALPNSVSGCSYTQFRPCQDLLGYDGFVASDFQDAANNICHVCIRVEHSEQTITLDEDSFPGPLAVDFRLENNPQDFCDSWSQSVGFLTLVQWVFTPLVQAITLGNWLMLSPKVAKYLQWAYPGSLPGCPLQMDVLLGAAGFAEYDYTPLWWDAEYDRSHYTLPIDLFWHPENGQVSHIEDTCCLQQALDSGFGVFFRDQTEIPGYGSISLQDVIRAADGIRISEHKQALFFKILPTWTRLEDVWGSNCTDGISLQELQQTRIIGLDAYGLVTSQTIDIPGTIARSLATSPSAVEMGVGVMCNHGKDCTQVGAVDENGDGHCDCEERGLADLDRDGFCDNEPDGSGDLCPWGATGMNCDSDGDGFGDAVRHMYDNCIVNLAPGLRGEEREVLRHQLCGGCDNCPSIANTKVHTAQVPNLDLSPTDQVDRDRDGIGDACEEDADSDGVHREWDCDDLNPDISFDRDGDGTCDPLTAIPEIDPWARVFCIHSCADNASWYHSNDFDESECLARCSNTDNAFDRDLVFCQYVERCTATDAAARPQNCPAQHCRFVPGPSWPDSFVGNRCIPLQAKQCAKAWANAEQRDSDGDGEGDRMDYRPWVQGVYFGSGAYGLAINSCRDHVVGFRTSGGDIYSDPTKVDENGYLVPQFSTVTRDGVNVGACTCDLPLQDGEWSEICSRAENCPSTTENHFVAPGVYRRTWNPINAPQAWNGLHVTNPDYPVAQGLPANDVRTHVEQDGLIYAREVGFTHDPGSPGYHSLDWYAHSSVEFYTWSAVDWPAERDMAKTKVRVAWPSYLSIDQDGSQFVVFSQPGPTSGDCGLVGARARYVARLPSEEPALPPETVVSVIPGPPPVFTPGSGSARSPKASRPGYFVGKDPETGALSLNALGSDTPRVVARWALEDDGLLDRPELLRGAGASLTGEIAGLQASSTEAVFVYRPASPGDVGCESLACGGYEPARFYVATETVGEPITLQSSEDLWGQQSPDLFDARVIYADKEHSVLLIGRFAAAAPVDLAWRLDLGAGEWHGPYELALPDPLSGYAFRYDPVSRKVLAFGGGSTTDERIVSAQVHAIDPMTLAVRTFATLDPPPAMLLARSAAGSWLEPAERALYVYGGSWGSGGPVTHKDVWRLNLASRRWSLVHETDLAESPEPVLEPFLYVNRRRATVWVGDFLGRSTADGLRLHALDPDGVWHAMPAIRLPSAQTWPAQGTYTPGARPSYPWVTPEDTSLPGALSLATLQAGEPFLGVKVYSPEAELLGESMAGPAGQQVAGFLCPVDGTCTLEVSLLPRGGIAAWLPYTLSVVPADLALEDELQQPGRVAGIASRHGRLYVASSSKLRAYGLGDLLDPRGELQGWAVAAARALVPCAGQLCLARPGIRGLIVISLADPDQPQVTHRSFTAGLGWDVAASGRRVYLAHGLLGVGVYAIGSGGQPAYVQSICTGGVVRSVAVQKDLLAAASLFGEVKLYRLGDTIASAGELQARGKVDRVRFIGGYLWVRGKRGGWAEVWDVRDSANPVQVGEVTGSGLALMEAVFYGDRAYGFEKNRLQAYRVQPTE
jgi:hypothetical protein